MIVFKRDLYQCRICRKAGVELEVDHIVPLGRGGSNGLENLQTLCVVCNRGKGANLQ
jgi:5-methylcytosine-specific restriction endonuclease McrA